MGKINKMNASETFKDAHHVSLSKKQILRTRSH